MAPAALACTGAADGGGAGLGRPPGLGSARPVVMEAGETAVNTAGEPRCSSALAGAQRELPGQLPGLLRRRARPGLPAARLRSPRPPAAAWPSAPGSARALREAEA